MFSCISWNWCSLKRRGESGKNEIEWTRKVNSKTRKKFLATGKACMAIFWPTPGFKARTTDNFGLWTKWTLISASTAPYCGDGKGTELEKGLQSKWGSLKKCLCALFWKYTCIFQQYHNLYCLFFMSETTYNKYTLGTSQQWLEVVLGVLAIRHCYSADKSIQQGWRGGRLVIYIHMQACMPSVWGHPETHLKWNGTAPDKNP